MNENIVIPGMFMATVIVLALGIPLVRAFVRRQDQRPIGATNSPDIIARLDRIEAMVETVAVEVERLSEGQRFTTRLLSEGAAQASMKNGRAAASTGIEINERVTHA
jgi:hypothetical protein